MTMQQCTGVSRCLLALVVSLCVLVAPVAAWGSSSSSSSETDETSFGNTFARDWLYDSKSLSIKVEGCAWGYVEDSEEVGCLEDDSDEGTTNWYMMANCRRPQVIFSVYASSSGSTSCNSNNFVGSFVTKTGFAEFVYYLQQYDGNYNYNGDDGYDIDGLPTCEQGNAGYIGLDCSSGAWVLNYYNDQYCVSRTGEQYDQLKNINKMMSNYEQCLNAWSDGDGYDNSLVHQLVYYAEPCTSYDYNLCQDNGVFQSRSSSSATRTNKRSSRTIGSNKSFATKFKYVVGGLFLVASFIMFTGILFTNRRRRRAMMMRKYRQAKKAKREKGKDGESKKEKRSSSKKRSKSRTRDKSEGVFT
eukprot:Nitzschia sp. Nitz4//scaffold4_size323378//183770//184931//NITZ4_000669-RA/size323378-processed-gene-0.288-mRNA-1//1//CDS//3329553426//4857//frame0